MQNPMYSPKVLKRELLPVKVCYVYKEPFDRNDPIFKKIRDFCHDMNIMFEAREFDSDSYRHDRYNITRLPAMHLYEQGKHETTFYPNGRPIQTIFQACERVYQKPKQKWSIQKLFS